MGDHREIKRIACYASASASTLPQLQEGILRYAEEHSGFTFRDFRPYGDSRPFPLDRLGPLPWGDWEPHGIIAVGAGDPAVADWFGQEKRTIVMVGADWSGRLPSVYTAPDSVAALALKHFKDLGIVNIAFVGPAASIHSEMYRHALARQLAAIGRHLLLFELESNPEEGFSAECRAASELGLVRLLATAPKPLAVLVSEEIVGRVVSEACLHLRLAVPGSVAVLCVGNTIVARMCQPPLSAIETPCEEIGYQAMALLDWLLRHRGACGAPRVEIAATRVVARHSTRAAPNGAGMAFQLRQMIRARACQGASIDEIIAQLGVSRSTLDRQFSAAFGLSPGQEVSRVRLERAKELLMTGMPVKRVAAAVGYQAASSFNDFFRKQTGMTPQAFRGRGRTALNDPAQAERAVARSGVAGPQTFYEE